MVYFLCTFAHEIVYIQASPRFQHLLLKYKVRRSLGSQGNHIVGMIGGKLCNKIRFPSFLIKRLDFGAFITHKTLEDNNNVFPLQHGNTGSSQSTAFRQFFTTGIGPLFGNIIYLHLTYLPCSTNKIQSTPAKHKQRRTTQTSNVQTHTEPYHIALVPSPSKPSNATNLTMLCCAVDSQSITIAKPTFLPPRTNPRTHRTHFLFYTQQELRGCLWQSSIRQPDLGARRHTALQQRNPSSMPSVYCARPCLSRALMERQCTERAEATWSYAVPLTGSRHSTKERVQAAGEGTRVMLTIKTGRPTAVVLRRST